MYSILLIIALIGGGNSDSGGLTSQLIGKYQTAQECNSVASNLNLSKIYGSAYVEKQVSVQCIYIGK